MARSGEGTGSGAGRRRGLLFLASVVIVVQLVSWRGTVRLKAASFGPVARHQETLNTVIARRSLNPEQGSSYSIGKGKARLFDDQDNETIQLSKKEKHKKEKNHSSSTSSSTSLSSSITSTTSVAPECKPLPTRDSPAQQCAHIRSACPPSGHIDYLQFYYCIGVETGEKLLVTPSGQGQPTPAPKMSINNSRTQQDQAAYRTSSQLGTSTDPPDEKLTGRLRGLRVLALVCIIVWMLFLFSWVGLVASDFFCPNLGTIAARLGLSESTAGVTFLAFGNGSPDVFSTFGAMRTGSGSLAIGELIGAASFIVSVISGSMMLIAPFRVKRYPFLRDVGFFTAAVAITMTFLFDGKLLFSECMCLIALYISYAATVIGGSWWQSRQRRRGMVASVIRDNNAQRSPSPQPAPAADDMERQTSRHSGRGITSPGRPLLSATEYDPDIDPFASWETQQAEDRSSPLAVEPSPSHSPLLLPHDHPSAGSSNFNSRLQRFRAGIVARHSLLGAVEFRDVVRNLQNESLADNYAEVYQSRDPERFLPHEHTHHHHQQDANASGLGHPPASGADRHKRNLSVAPILGKADLGDAKAHQVIHRSQSLTGPSSQELNNSRMQQASSRAVGGQAAVADAVDDPWREHGPGDACETPNLLPSPALSLGRPRNVTSASDEINASKRQTLPRLAIRRPTGSSAVLNGNEDSQARRAGSRSISRERIILPSHARRSFRPLLKALFPSLRHLHQKSWLGIFIGVVTAPAILLLNLTLPVVDDATDQAYLTGEKEGDFGTEGRIRLGGEETNLNARAPHLSLDESEEEEEDYGNGRNIITLGSSSVDSNPWDSAGSATNRRDQLSVASVLHHLPGEISPMTGAPSPKGGHFASYGASDAGSVHSDSSDSSCDSHAASSQASHAFLLISQCALAPPFCVWAITSSADSNHVLGKTLSALVGGLVFAAFVLLARMHYKSAMRRNPLVHRRAIVAFGWCRVALGFLVSILYIMTIVDEVVSILQTLGIILGLSDAILGLTIFAMGNSLGDLVANITIARMGHPVMAISACFAGPLLNLLLGIGISGSWLLSGGRADSSTALSWAYATGDVFLEAMQRPQHHAHDKAIYHIDVSPTLGVSGVGLLVILVGTLIAVPLNKFYLDRRIGMALIVTYGVIMCTNVAVEVYNMKRGSDM